ncbi:MAG: hypothetical protein IIU73_02060 [Selenomonadales bacterium]|nr:hypothetical protein [Selenomonadales bacterium]
MNFIVVSLQALLSFDSTQAGDFPAHAMRGVRSARSDERLCPCGAGCAVCTF